MGLSLERVWKGGLATAMVALLAASACGDDDGPGSGSTPDGAVDSNPPGPLNDADVDAGPQRASFGLDTRPSNATCKLARPPTSTAAVRFDEVYTNNVLGIGPMQIAQAPGDRTRWFAATRNGRFVSFPASAAGPTTELTTLAGLSGLPIEIGGEGGFLGFAFHPQFQQNGRIYVSWTTADSPSPFVMKSRVGYITTPDKGTTFTSYTNILDFDQPYSNHKGGTVAFGQDGKLYLSFGDGGDYFGQRGTGFFSKILRVDVDQPTPGKGYSIPADNPFATSTEIEPATFARGFRNPFRFSIDRGTGDIWVGDVGHALWEEIDHVVAGGNYGWPCREGKHNYSAHDPLYCPPGTANLIDPVAEYEHVAPNAASRSITGGVIYRGAAIPSLIGGYIFGDFVTKEIFALKMNPVTGAPEMPVLNPSGPTGGWVQFAEDLDGEVYALDLFGHIYKMVPAGGGDPADGGTFPTRLSQTGCVDAANPKNPAIGLVPFAVNMELWSDGAEKERFVALRDGTTMAIDPASGDIQIPVGGVLMKTFKLQGKPIETRLFVHHDDGVWQGYSYEWLDDQSDAVLLPSSKRKQVGDRAWYFPSRTDCLRCHTEAAGRSLGIEVGQLQRDFVYASTNRISSQLATLEHIGMFAAPVGQVAPTTVLPSLADANASDESRARAYLHVNCSNCHRPNGGAVGDMDLRFNTPFANTKTCNVVPVQGNSNVANSKLITPGMPSLSLVSIRPRALGSGRMPPLASQQVDQAGVGVIDSWIGSLSACP